MRSLWAVSRLWIAMLALGVALAGCASLAVNPCDTIADRDGKYFGRFFLGVATIGLSEVTIQQEEVRQAYQGSPGCPPPPGVRVVSPPGTLPPVQWSRQLEIDPRVRGFTLQFAEADFR